MVYVLSVAGCCGVGLESPLPVTITALGLRKNLKLEGFSSSSVSLLEPSWLQVASIEYLLSRITSTSSLRASKTQSWHGDRLTV